LFPQSLLNMNKITVHRFTLIILYILLGKSFAFGVNELNIINKNVSFGNYCPKTRTINAIIVHSTFNASGGDFYDINLILAQFKRYRVSSHYIIERDGKIFRLVKENNTAYHAGKSQLPNRKGSVNACSIGIELVNSAIDTPTEFQLKSLILLVKDIKKRYKIGYVLRHSDIAPGRKTDPWNLNWEDFLHNLSAQKPVFFKIKASEPLEFPRPSPFEIRF